MSCRRGSRTQLTVRVHSETRASYQERYNYIHGSLVALSPCSVLGLRHGFSNSQLLVVRIKLIQICRVAQYLVTASLQLDLSALTSRLLARCLHVLQVLVEHLAAHRCHDVFLVRIDGHLLKVELLATQATLA